MISPARGRGYKKPRHLQRQKKPGYTEPQAEASHQDAPLPQQQPPPDVSDHESGTEDFGLPNMGNFENSSFSLDFNLSDFTPVPEISCFDNVGQHVPLKLKQKIWEGQFIDLSLLLKSAKEINNSLGGQGEIKIRDGKFCIVKANVGPYLTIDKWTDAFMIFMSVMLEKFRTRAQEMLKYMRDIRLAAARSQGWFKYDEQYRLRKASQPESSWGVINHEFWLLYVTGQAGSESKAQVNNAKQFSGENSTSTAIQYCYHFNQGKRCNFFPRCRFKHICRRCGGKHPASNCFNNKSAL